jgi:hypothetical protein
MIKSVVIIEKTTLSKAEVMLIMILFHSSGYSFTSSPYEGFYKMTSIL